LFRNDYRIYCSVLFGEKNTIIVDWKIVDGKLVQLYLFDTQTQLAEFLLKVANYADSIDHHPDYKVFQCSKVEFALFTHDKNEITELDHQLAAFITSCYNNY